jgi:Skp family chaperone for outer membrane proteins
MKRTFVGTAVLTLILAGMSLAQTAPAAGSTAASTAAPVGANTPGGVKVGIIDIQQAIVGTNEGARDFEALQKKFEPKRNELTGLNGEIESLKKQLNTQGDKMNEEARASLVKQIESKQKVLQRTGEDAKNDYDQQQSEVAQRILQKMAPVIDKYAKTNGYGLLFDSSNPWPQGPLLWATAGVDLTKAVVDAYNSQSNVPAPVRPAGAPAPGKPVGTATPPGAKPTAAASSAQH